MFKNLLIKLESIFLEIVKRSRKIIKQNFNLRLQEKFKALFVQQNEEMEEVPNLKYIKTLSSSDIKFHNAFLKTLSEEYNAELRAYVFCIENGAPRAAASKVNKLKDKLNILGMKKAFNFADRHQRKLQKGNKSSDQKFKKILAKTNQFLMKQKQIYKLVN